MPRSRGWRRKDFSWVLFFFFFSQLLYSHLRSFNDKEQTLVVAGYFCQPHIPVARTLLIPQTGKPGHFQSSVFPLEVWDPFKKILYFVTFVTSGYPNKARERSVHFFTSRQAIEPDLLWFFPKQTKQMSFNEDVGPRLRLTQGAPQGRQICFW